MLRNLQYLLPFCCIAVLIRSEAAFSSSFEGYRFIKQDEVLIQGERGENNKCRAKLWGNGGRPAVSLAGVARGDRQVVRRAALVDSETCTFRVQTGYIRGEFPGVDRTVGRSGQRVQGSTRTHRRALGAAELKHGPANGYAAETAAEVGSQVDPEWKRYRHDIAFSAADGDPWGWFGLHHSVFVEWEWYNQQAAFTDYDCDDWALDAASLDDHWNHVGGLPDCDIDGSDFVWADSYDGFTRTGSDYSFHLGGAQYYDLNSNCGASGTIDIDSHWIEATLDSPGNVSFDADAEWEPENCLDHWLWDFGVWEDSPPAPLRDR